MNLSLILAAAVLRSFLISFSGVAYHGVLSLLYLIIYFEWLFAIRRRFLHKRIRRLLLGAASLMIYWIIIRYIKYEIVPAKAALNRYLWYSYYMPITLIPLQFFLATLYVGKPERSDVSRRWMLLYLPVGLMIGGVLTNDLHQAAFRFPQGFTAWNEIYTHGPLYFAAAGFAVLCMIGCIVTVFRTCIRHHFRRYFLLPVAELGIGAVYFSLYASFPGEKMFFQKGMELPEFTCLALIGFWECLVYWHLIPSNRNHQDFFQASSIHAGLTDDHFLIQMKAPSGIMPAVEEIIASEKGDVLMEDGHTLLKSRFVQGGHFYWMEDMTEQNRLNRELEETGDYLTEEHAILDAETKLEESRKRSAQQSQLYDQIAKSVQAQLDEIGEILDHLPEDEEGFRQGMKVAGILGAYIKRRSNLLLLASDGQEISTDELNISIRESLEYVQLLNIPCHAEIAGGYQLSAGLALLLYEMCEAVIESSLPGVKGLLVTLHVSENGLTFYMEAASPTDQPDIRQFEEAVGRYAGKLQADREDNVLFVTFTMAMEGGGA